MAQIFDKKEGMSTIYIDKPIFRANGQPLTRNEIFYSLTLAEEYAKTAEAYVGQKIAVIENNIVTHYSIIDIDGNLEELGKKIIGDNASIELNGETLSLYNYGKAFYKYVPEVKDAEGNITTAASYEKVIVSDENPWQDGLEPRVVTETIDGKAIKVIGWYQQNPTTVEGLAASIAALDSRTTELEKLDIDNKSIESKLENGKNVLSIKDVAADTTTNGKILAADGQGGIKWVDDKDTVTRLQTADGSGIRLAHAEPEEGNPSSVEIYELAHQLKPTTGVAQTAEAGNSGTRTYITEVLVDTYGHVAGVKTETETVENTDTLGKNIVSNTADGIVNAAAENNNVYLNHIENEQVVSSHNIKGAGATEVTSDANGNITINTTVPDVEISIEEDNNVPPTQGLVSVIENLEVTGHSITGNKVRVATKEYVDEIMTNGVQYLGTVSSLSDLSNTVGKGDFYRVSQDFEFFDPESGDERPGETAHVGDIIIATKDNPSALYTDWDLIHTEIDQDTWTANTKEAAGYVEKGEGQVNKVWKTDSEGNPGWRDEQDISGKMDKVNNAGKGHYAVFGDDGQVIDGGYIHATSYGEEGIDFGLYEYQTTEYGTDNPFMDNPLLEVSLLPGPGIELTKEVDSLVNSEENAYTKVSGVIGLSQDILDKIDIIPTNGQTGHYAIFDENGKLTDGGFLVGKTNFGTVEDNGTSIPELSFELHEYQSQEPGYENPNSDNPLLQVALRAGEGIDFTNVDFEYGESAADQKATISGTIGLSKDVVDTLSNAITDVKFVNVSRQDDAQLDDSGTSVLGLQLINSQGTYSGELFIATEESDGIIMNIVEGQSGQEADSISGNISLAPWAKNKLQNSVQDITFGTGLVGEVSYIDKEGNSVDRPEEVTTVKSINIDIDSENTTFIINCGSAADLI